MFLSVNGYEVQVADGKASDSVVLLGDSARTFDGTLVSTTTAAKRTLEVATPPLPAATAEPLRCLLQGGDLVGQTWSFDDTTGTDWQWSSRGLAKASGTATTLSPGKFGAGIEIASGGTVTWAPGAATRWTLMVWRRVAGVWAHWILCSDGTKYQNGTATATSITWLAFSAGTVTLGDSGSALAQYFDDLVFLPCVVIAEMAAAFGTATAAFSELPKLTLGGDFIPEGSRTVEGEDVTMQSVQAAFSTGWETTGRVVSATLVEV